MSDEVPDHYAALDLTPSCSQEDIGKAYKKLALKYHPDRNRGNEQEAVPRFQAIQAAHDTLKDPQTRRNYDLSRARPTYGATGFNRQPATRGNPYQARSDFPPPPMRTNPNARQSPNTARRGTGTPRGGMGSGIFPPPPPPRAQQKTSANQDARDRANMFEAWQSMHGKRTSPERKSHSQASPTKGTNHAGAYFSGANLDPRGQPQRASSDDASQKKSAYQSTQEQRPGMHRTPSHQPPPKRGGFDPSTPGLDERPASGGTHGYSTHKRSEDEAASNTNGFTQRGHAPTAKRPETQRSYDSSHPDHTRYNGHSSSRSHADPDDFRQFKNAYDTSSPHMQQERGPFGRPTARANSRHRSVSPRRQHTKPLTTYSSSSDSDIESSAGRPTPLRDPRDRPKAVPRARRSGTSTPAAATPAGMDGSKENPNIFSFPIESDTFQRSFGPVPPPGKINTNFSSSTTTPAFTTPTEIPRRASQPSSFPFTFQGGPPQSTSAQPSQTTTPLESPLPRIPGPYNGAGPAATGAFSADQWSQTLGSTNWASQWAQAPQARSFAPSQSPTRRARSVRHGSVRIPSNVPRPVSIADDLEAGPPQDWTDSDTNAMDVDTTIPAGVPANTQSAQPVPPTVSSQSPTTPTQARTVYVEPSKAEWATRPPPSTTTSQPPNDPMPSSIPFPPPPASTRPPPASSTLNMNDFRHVAPFDTSANGNGLTNLKDITSTLPFESKSSSKAPTTATAPLLDLPKLPKAPTPPSNLTSISQSDLLTYLRSMAAYLGAWATFKSTLLSIMTKQMSRIGEMERDVAGTGSDDIMRDWLIATGETETKRGWEAYRVAVKQEERVREYWKVASERHWIAVEGHERVRERLRALREVG